MATGVAPGIEQKFPAAQHKPMEEEVVPLQPPGTTWSRSLHAANNGLACIRNSMHTRSKEEMVFLYSSHVRVQLEYCSSFGLLSARKTLKSWSMSN